MTPHERKRAFVEALDECLDALAKAAAHIDAAAKHPEKLDLGILELSKADARAREARLKRAQFNAPEGGTP